MRDTHHAYRGSGMGRPPGIPLPPARMPLLRAGRLLKRWRYVSIWSAELSIWVASTLSFRRRCMSTSRLSCRL